ncbi:MAG: HD domain-containing phosphohydrolase [Thermodesulfobacteriota bacterium]
MKQFQTSSPVLLIEDEPIQRKIVCGQLQASGFSVIEADNGKEGLRLWRENPGIRLVITDLMMPIMDGYNVIELIRNEENHYTYLLVLSGLEDRHSLVRALELGADDYLTKPVFLDELKLRLKNAGRLIRLDGMDDLVFGLAELSGYRSGETGQHLRRVQAYCHILAKYLLTEHPELQITHSLMVDIVNASPLHDIGKVAIPDAVLHKTGKLGEEEFELIKSHTTIGGKLLLGLYEKNGSNFLKLAYEVAVGHHEKWDGTGYPSGLRGYDIPLASRIMAVADVYDALTSDRCYKEAITTEQAAQIIADGANYHFDPLMVDAFIKTEQDWLKVRQELRDPVDP